MKKTLLAGIIAAMLSSPFALAQNYGFEDGTTSGWTVGGDTGPTPNTGTVPGFVDSNNQPRTVNLITQQGMGVKVLNGPIAFQADSYGAMGSQFLSDGVTPNPYYQPAVTPKTWVFSPYGTYMVGLQPNAGQSSAAFTALQLQTSDVGTQDFALTTVNKWTPNSINWIIQEQKIAAGYGNTGITTAAWIYRDVAMTPGTTLKFAWNYVGTDYVPFNDGSIATLVNTADPTVLGTLNNYNSRYALLGFTNPKTGDYSAGTFGSTGWQIATFSVSAPGDYRLGFASFNLGDTALSPLLLIDEWQGGTVTCAEGSCTTFGTVAPNNSTAPTAESVGGGTSTPTTDPIPTTVENITGATPTASLGNNPKFNGGTITIADGDIISKNFGITNAGGTVDTGAGLVGEISGVISNDGASTSGTLTVDGQGTLKLSGVNSYTGPTVINYGAFLVLLNGNAIAQSSSITNNGGLNITGAGPSTVVAGNYTQGSTGGLIATLTPTGATQLNVNGEALLAGTYTLHANQGLYAYGKYTLITSNGVTGQFDTFATNLDSFYGNYLKYSADKVQLYVTPNAGATQASVNQVAGDTGNALNIQSSSLNSALGNDCNLFGENGGCVSTGVGVIKAAGGDLTSGNLTVAKKINDNWRAGLFLNQQFNNPTYGGVRLDQSGPAVGGFVTWSKDRFEVQASAAGVSNKLNITRNGPELGQAQTTSNGTAYQLKGSYLVPVTEKTTVTPYVGVRYTQLNVGGYTEQGPVFPLTVNSTKQTTTDALAGVGVSHKITDKLTGSASVGVVQNISYQAGTVSGTSEVANLSTFNATMPGSGYTSAALGAGMSYEVAKNQRVGVNVGWQQKTLVNSNVGSFGVNYTVGF